MPRALVAFSAQPVLNRRTDVNQGRPTVFDIHCRACDKRQLIFSSQVRSLVNDDQGIAVLFTCWCGADGAWRTGAARSGTRPAPHGEHALAS